MFVKVYRYKVRSKDFGRWQRIYQAAGRVYRQYGNPQFAVFTKQDKGIITILDINYWKSKKVFQKTIKRIDADKRIQKLFREMLTLLQGKVVEEDFETSTKL